MTLGYTYETFTTFWDDFSIADHFGASGVKDTFNRAFGEWKHDYKYLTELVMVLNHKIWQLYKTRPALARLYNELWERAQNYAYDNLEGDELSYFYNVTD